MNVELPRPCSTGGDVVVNEVEARQCFSDLSHALVGGLLEDLGVAPLKTKRNDVTGFPQSKARDQ